MCCRWVNASLRGLRWNSYARSLTCGHGCGSCVTGIYGLRSETSLKPGRIVHLGYALDCFCCRDAFTARQAQELIPRTSNWRLRSAAADEAERLRAATVANAERQLADALARASADADRKVGAAIVDASAEADRRVAAALADASTDADRRVAAALVVAVAAAELL